jgi:hypothetical protein
MEEEKKEGEHKTGHEEKHHLEKMTVHELREIAKEIPDVTGVTGMKKEHLLEIIKKHRGIEDDKPVKHKAVAKVAMTVQELKHRIIKFKADRKAAVEKRDKKRATILRRRINRLKKRIRKAEEKAA